jgi:dTDP-4-amino-4,6-dideoxygalactose transaminase
MRSPPPMLLLSANRQSRLLPVYRPALPPFEALRPYLERIDSSRNYSNFGSLNADLSVGLATKLGLEVGQLVLASSGTAALMAAILACAGRATDERPYCMLPAYTFGATAFAAEMCGYSVHFVDIRTGKCTIHADSIAGHPLLDRVGLVLPVCAYGLSIPAEDWQAFRERTGIPVVIDGAAAFEQLRSGVFRPSRSVPLALSFQATKAFATAEGGAIVSRDPDLAAAFYRAINFGMLGERAYRSPGFNGKMSEYHAAVGHAELSRWESKEGAFREVAIAYQEEFARRDLAHRIVTAPKIASCYVLFLASSEGEASAIGRTLLGSGIDHRLWYGRGLHHEPYFASAPSDELANTDRLAPRLIGLPAAPDLTREDVIAVADAVRTALDCA